jgi:mannitol-1-/sugar-/sorbitol-6-phosphatase
MRRFDCSAVILDLDGVLVDSTALVEDQWRRWAAARGLQPEPFLRICHGRRALETIRLAAPQLDAEAEVAALPADTEPGAEIRALAGAARLLDQLPPGTWAVATSGSRAAATLRLRRAGLPVPPVMVCAEDVKQGKPHPEVYQRAAMALEVSPTDCLVIEDAPAGIEAARAAGMTAIGLATTPEPAELPVDVCAGSLADVHLGRIGPEERGRLRLEVLVIEVARDRVPASFEPRRALRASAGREPRG